MAKSGTVLLGPWGGEGGDPWSYNVIGNITNIVITYDANGVNSVKFTCRDVLHGTSIQSRLFGSENGDVKEIIIDTNEERLISMEGSVGTYNSIKRVTSLGFTTSTMKHAPVGGGEKDSEFSCVLSEDPFSGFFGRCGTVLNSIGVSTVVKTRELVGPWPPRYNSGNPWDYISKGPVSLISVTYDDEILHSLQFGSHDAHGDLHKSDIYGISDGNKSSEVEIDTRVERIIGISGAYGSYSGMAYLIKSVTFITDNLRSIGPFGNKKDQDIPFSYTVQGDELLTGFHGQSGTLIRTIGVYIQPSKSSVKVGPFCASDCGKWWDYMPKGIISRIYVTHEGAFDTLQFESIDENGFERTSNIFGHNPGPRRYTIDIDKDDKLTGISGAVGPFSDGILFITEVYIYTQKKNVYGPFGNWGKGKGSKFSFQVKDGYISGFFGRSTVGNHAIGIYVKPNN